MERAAGRIRWRVRQAGPPGAGGPVESAGDGGKESAQPGGAFLRQYEERDFVRLLHIPGGTCEGTGLHGKCGDVGIPGMPIAGVIEQPALWSEEGSCESRRLSGSAACRWLYGRARPHTDA